MFLSSTSLVRIPSFVFTLVAAILFVSISQAAPAAPDSKADEVRQKLAKPSTLEFEPNTPLKEALGCITDKYELNILIDVEAFDTVLEIWEPEEQPIKLPKMVNMKLGTVLQILCDQVQGVYVQKGAIVWVLPNKKVGSRLMKQPVNLTIEKTSLAEVLRDLSDQSGMSIVVDQRAAQDKAQALLSADLRGVSLDAAVRTLADMVDLKPAVIDRVIYLTTKDNANVLQAEEDRKRQEAEKGELTRKPARSGLSAHQVTLKSEQKSFAEALRELSAHSGVSMVVDPRAVGDKEQRNITADLKNVTLDAAVRILADMVGLQPVVIDRVVYFTTPANAKTLQAQEDQRRREAVKRDKSEKE